MMVIRNKAGGEVGIIAFDGLRGEWRISGYDLHGFRSMQDAWNFWHCNFDPATGQPRFADKRLGHRGFAYNA
jgi:hypothetical protein